MDKIITRSRVLGDITNLSQDKTSELNKNDRRYKYDSEVDADKQNDDLIKETIVEGYSFLSFKTLVNLVIEDLYMLIIYKYPVFKEDLHKNQRDPIAEPILEDKEKITLVKVNNESRREKIDKDFKKYIVYIIHRFKKFPVFNCLKNSFLSILKA